MEKVRYIRISSRYGSHYLLPVREYEENRMDLLFMPTITMRLIGKDFNFPEAIDPEGGPFLSIGDTIYENNKPIAKLTKIDARGKYIILECNKLPSLITPWVG